MRTRFLRRQRLQIARHHPCLITVIECNTKGRRIPTALDDSACEPAMPTITRPTAADTLAHTYARERPFGTRSSAVLHHTDTIGATQRRCLAFHGRLLRDSLLLALLLSGIFHVRAPKVSQTCFVSSFIQLPLQAYIAAMVAPCSQIAATAKWWYPGASPSPPKRCSNDLLKSLLISNIFSFLFFHEP